MSDARQPSVLASADEKAALLGFTGKVGGIVQGVAGQQDVVLPANLLGSRSINVPDLWGA